jgi:putative component of toxin-antitoxin plasmid stabilization module
MFDRLQIRFEKLFEVEIYHNFYSDGISADFSITPTASCRRLLREYGLLFRMTAKGFAVFYEVAPPGMDTAISLKPIAEDVRFSFMLQSRNPLLNNYTDIPLDNSPGGIYYLHNLNGNVQSSQLLLSSDTASEYLNGQDALELRAQTFAHEFETANAAERIEVLDQFSTPVIQQTVQIVEGRFSYPVDLRPFGAGGFTLRIENGDTHRFYAGDELIGKNLFGIIDIFRHDDVPGAYQFTDAANAHAVTPKTYTVKLDNRKTFWKYFLVLKYHPFRDKPPSEWPNKWRKKLKIIYPSDPPIEFKPQMENLRIMADGSPAIPFEAPSALPLQQAPVKGIHLQPNGDGNGHAADSLRRIDNLPTPAIASVLPSATDDNIYSEIFIYI